MVQEDSSRRVGYYWVIIGDGDDDEESQCQVALYRGGGSWLTIDSIEGALDEDIAEVGDFIAVPEKYASIGVNGID
jgi:hypothetical protein